MARVPKLHLAPRSPRTGRVEIHVTIDPALRQWLIQEAMSRNLSLSEWTSAVIAAGRARILEQGETAP